MRNVILGIVVLAVVAGAVAAFLHQQGDTPEAARERLADQFMAILPDSLSDRHREEIEGLFQTLWHRHERGLVADADIDSITTRMQAFVDAGRIGSNDLVYYMAEVGYKTYAGEKRYQLPSGVVDHPVLNPEGATVDMLSDSIGHADWLADQERKAREARDRGDSDGP